MRSDEELCRSVEAELAWELGDCARPLAVDVLDGVATLSGTVHCLRHKLAAPDAARRVYGVQDVNEQLRVVPTESDRRDDPSLSSAVALALSRAALVPRSVASQVRDGVVTLTGRVVYQFECDEARRVATGITGVVLVVDEIVLANAGRRRER
jgi:osmotically-inducible protein OsmY